MNARVVGVAWYRLRAGFARKWSGYLSLVLLIALVGGLAFASLAGARRTESSFTTYLASTNPSTIAVFSRYHIPSLGLNTGYDAHVAQEIAHLPFVKRSATAIVFDGNIDLPSIKGIHPNIKAGEEPPGFLGSTNGEFSSMDKVSLLAGRSPSPSNADEAMMNAGAAQEEGLHIGSVIHIPFYSDVEVNSSAPSNPKIVTVKMVGEFVASRDVLESDINALGSSALIFSPALTDELAAQFSTGTETFLQLSGGDTHAKLVLSEIDKVDPVATHLPSQITSQFVPITQQAITPEAVALGVFGAVAGLTVLLIAGLAIGRIIRIGVDDMQTLRALGASRGTLLADEVLGLLAAVVLGSLLAVAFGVALSPLAPLGPVRPVYPTPGIAFDWTVLVVGFLAILVVLGSLAVVLAGREVRRATTQRRSPQWKREPAWARTAAASGMAISVLTGLRFALEPGRGRSASPVRSATTGAVLAVTVLAATVTFGASLDSLVSHPSLFGWNWDYAMMASFGGQENLPAHQVATLLDADHDIAAWSGANFSDAELDGVRTGVLVEQPGAGVAPPILTGHGLEAANDIVLGATTMSQLHRRIGDTVTFANGISKPTTLTIVGTATFPAVANGNVGMGNGALAATSDFPKNLLNLQGAELPGPSFVFVRIRSGVDSAAAYASLVKINNEVNAIPAASGLAGGVVKVLRPVEIVNFHAMGETPTALATGLAAGAVLALGLTLATSVRRRRRDLALLKALGFTQRQLASAIAWQATVAGVIGVVVGMPLGIIIGREFWLAFAHSINAVPEATVPVRTMALVGVGALVFANLVAALPGRMAARTPTALVLRAE
jgi:hypothetical protein